MNEYEEYTYLRIGELILQDDEVWDSITMKWREPYPLEIGGEHSNPDVIVRRCKIKTGNEETTMKDKFIIGSINKETGIFSFATKPAIHQNFISAQQEAERLATIDIERKFVVLKISGICSVADVTWE